MNLKTSTGVTILLHFPPRKSTASKVPNWTISYNDLSMTVDEDNLPTSLYKLLPKPYCSSKPDDWIPFCCRAIALKLMK
jgi:hypothetical protein